MILTRRERDVFDLIARGETTRQIAATLGLSPHTVSQYVRRMMSKTGATSRAALVSAVLTAAAGGRRA
jgi:DNA-binding CsgD family transcriptional regulator